MAVHKLTLDSLRKLDLGKASTMFDMAISRLAADCLDRPADDRPREVTMKLIIKPYVDPDGSCSNVDLQIKVTSKIPEHQTKPYNLGIRDDGALLFNEHSPDQFGQLGLFEDGEDNAEGDDGVPARTSRSV